MTREKNNDDGDGRNDFVFLLLSVSGLFNIIFRLIIWLLSYTTYCINIRRTDWRRAKTASKEGWTENGCFVQFGGFLSFSGRRLRIIYGGRPHSIHITSDVTFHCSGEASTSQNF
ncbi:hypothetical protein ACFSQ7_13560 [Paenibacillus rhizoplanae]